MILKKLVPLAMVAFLALPISAIANGTHRHNDRPLVSTTDKSAKTKSVSNGNVAPFDAEKSANTDAAATKTNQTKSLSSAASAETKDTTNKEADPGISWSTSAK